MKDNSENFGKYIRWFWGLFAGSIFLVILIFILIAKGMLGFMPTFEELENPKNALATEILYADGKLLDKLFIEENRSYVEYKDLPKHLIDALVATEDVRFYKHSGIDFRGVLRAIKGIVTGNSSAGGGSTISQQLAKNLFPRNQDNISNKFQLVLRKLKEWVIAVKLERSYTKEEIMLMYLNKYDYGNLAMGIKTASNVYFGVEPGDMELQESAMLVGMAKNSSLYNPVRRPELVLQRRNVVLNQMSKYGYLTKAQRDSYKKLPLGLNYHPVDYKYGPAPYFREYLRRIINIEKPTREKYGSWFQQQQKYKEELAEWENNPLFGWCNKNKKPNGEKYNIYKDGLKIYTTLDSRMQRYANEAVENHLKNSVQKDFDSGIKYLKNPPFADDVLNGDIEKNLNQEIRDSERYRVLKKAGLNDAEIKQNFNIKTRMKIFSWKGEIDTTMTPMDSIKWYLRYFRSSMMVMETTTGKVKAYVGGPNYKYFMYDMVKDGKRQIGSTAKPFLYTIAMQNGMTPCTMVPYVSYYTMLPDGTKWEPKDVEGDDSENMEGKLVSLKWGLANSRNRISHWVMQQYSPEAMAEMMRRFGIYSNIDPVMSLFLGTSEISLYEMTGAFATFGNKGVYIKPYFVTRIEDKHGNLIASFQPQKHEAIDEKTAFTMLNMLEAVVNEGTGNRLRRPEYGGIKMQVGGKTGTTQNHADGWFIGVTPQLTAAVWTGADYPTIHFKTIRSGQGAQTALPIWGNFMKRVINDPSLGINENIQFKTPAGYDVNFDCNTESTAKPANKENDFF